jgi:hypothetical protein
MRERVIPKGKRTRVLHMLFDSVPQSVRFTAAPTIPGASLDGVVEVAGSTWLFRKKPVAHSLQASNELEKGFLDSRYAIYVTPEQDTVITFETKHFRARLLIITLLVVAALGFGAVLVRGVLGTG